MTYEKISEITLIIPTVSESNAREHWTKQHIRHKSQKTVVKWYANHFPKELPMHIKFTRIAPMFLDSQDNLPNSMKYILDEVCAQITGDHRPGKADSNPGFTFEYSQEKGRPRAVRIEFFRKQDTLTKKPKQRQKNNKEELQPQSTT